MDFFRALILAVAISGLLCVSGCQVKASGQMDVGVGVCH